MPEGLKYLFDAAVACALFLALMVVFAVDYFTSGPPKNTLENVRVIGGAKGTAKKLKLAVVKTREQIDGNGKTVKWDDMSKLLNKLGEGGDGYRHDLLSEDELIRRHDEKKLGEYDIIFLTCNDSPNDDMLKDPLQNYVANGGILYASDRRYPAIAKAFPEAKPFDVAEGAVQNVMADIVDADLQKAIGAKKIALNFNLAQWKPAAFSNVDVLIKGTYKEQKNGQQASGPLMVRFKFDKGTVIFTSFHNEAQNSRDEDILLQNLVFGLVTAGIDAELNSSLDREGFKPQSSNLLSTPAKGRAEKKYENDHVCTLRFGLGFRNEGYKLRFNIKSPSGKQFTQDCESTTILEVTDAEKGTWEYTVEALDAYANFAFRTTVGEKK